MTPKTANSSPQIEESEAPSPFLSSPPRSTLPRYRRDPQAPPLVLTPRDHALLEDVWRFGLLTTSQIETLRAGDVESSHRFVSRLTLTRRLKLLFHHRYLRRLARPLAQGSQEPVYVLDHSGARFLSLRHGEVSARAPSRLPKAVALDHLLEVGAVRVALSVAPPELGVQLLEWLPGEKVRFRASVESPGQRRQAVSLIPDAGIILRTRSVAQAATVLDKDLSNKAVPWQRHYAFLEVDRGSEAARLLSAKVRAYTAYWGSGGFAEDFSVPRGLGFWVLFVAPTPKRAQAILKAIAAVEGPRIMFRVALRDDISPQRIGKPVWHCGGVEKRSHFWEIP